MKVQLTGRIGTGQDLLDSDLRDLQIVTGAGAGAGGTMLYAATGQHGGISAWRLYDDGRVAALADTVYFTSAGMGIGPLAAVTLNGAPRLMLGGTGSGRMLGYDLQADGTLGVLARLDLPGGGGQTPAALISAALTGGNAAVYMVDGDTGALGAWGVTDAGALRGNVALNGDKAGFVLSGQVSLGVVKSGDVSFLLAAGSGGQGVSSYRIAPVSGALTLADSLGADDGLGVAIPTALQTVRAHGDSWVILAAAGSGSLSVMQVHSTGQLVPTDHLLDTRATRFGGVQALEVVKADGHVFVLAGGADDGISLFALLPGGRLVHLHSLAHEIGLGLENVAAIEARVMGDAIQVFVTSTTAAGLSQFTIPLDNLGAVIRDTNPALPANRKLEGTAGDDLIVAGTGRDTIYGRGGDDILVSGAGGSVLSGGNGADLFVLRPASGVSLITDFQPGIDRLDLTHFAMLRGVEQLKLVDYSNGIRLYYGENRIDVESHDGKPLTATDLWPGGFDTPDHVLVMGSSWGLTIQGTPRNDVLAGGARNDTIHAGAGADRVRAGDGADIIFGGRGNDTLNGGKGADTIRAFGGGDTSFGGRGPDKIVGGTGNDRLNGNAGSDVLWGSGGKDRLDGGIGRDVLLGGLGADILRGGAQDDILKGGGGNDRLNGQRGDDHLTGGAGADIFVFARQSGADVIHDFSRGTDRIRIEIAGVEFDDLELKRQGSDTVIDTGSGTITVLDLRPVALSGDDFLFT